MLLHIEPKCNEILLKKATDLSYLSHFGAKPDIPDLITLTHSRVRGQRNVLVKMQPWLVSRNSVCVCV